MHPEFSRQIIKDHIADLQRQARTARTLRWNRSRRHAA